MIVNPDLLASLAKREQWNCKHEEYEECVWYKERPHYVRCKKCGVLFKLGFMEAKMKDGETK